MENQIKFYRNKRNITQIEMAKMLNVSRQTYINYETGAFEPSLDILKKISQILQTSIDDLLDNEIFPSQRDDSNVSLLNELECLVKNISDLQL